MVGVRTGVASSSYANVGLVFIAERGEGVISVKLGDFGIAKFQTDGTDTYVGSRDYFAPVRSYQHTATSAFEH